MADDLGSVERGQPVCVVETTKASIELVSPGAGTLVQLAHAGQEVELGRRVAVIAESTEELSSLLEDRERAPAAEAAAAKPGKATKKAVELAEQHGIDLDSIEKDGFITAEDVAVVVARQTAAAAPVVDTLLAGVSTESVSLPASFGLDQSVGALDPGFLETLRSDPDRFRTLSSEERIDAYRGAGARIGENVVLGDGALLVAPRIVLDDDVRVGHRALVRCEEVVAIGELTQFGDDLELTCRRAFVGSNIWAGRSIRIGGGGNRDPWATLAIGDLTFLGDEIFLNPCRPVLIGREVFVTQRSMIVTHNVGHSLLEGFENRFAPVVLEDRSQVGLGAVVYAGCRIGRDSIVGSNSYVISDIPPGKLALGVPAKVAGPAHLSLPRARQVELASRMVDDLRELLELKGNPVAPLEGSALHGFELRTEPGPSVVVFVERLDDRTTLPDPGVEGVAMTLEFGDGEPPDGYAVFDLLGRQLHGGGGVLCESVREFCRKKGIRLSPGPWRYRGGFL